MAPPLTLTLILTLTLALALTQMELRDVHVSIPVPAADAPTVTDGEGASFNKREGVLTWVIPVIDSANGSGSIEFTAAVDSPDAFFPIDVRPEPDPNPNSNPNSNPNPNPNPSPSPNPDQGTVTGELQLHSLGGGNCGLHTQCAAARQPTAVRSPAQLVTSLVAQVEGKG